MNIIDGVEGDRQLGKFRLKFHDPLFYANEAAADRVLVGEHYIIFLGSGVCIGAIIGQSSIPFGYRNIANASRD